MTWFKVDDSFYDHPKVFDAPDCAVALWTRAGTWSARNLTDGFVPAGMPARLCDDPETAIKELVRRGLWTRVSGGFRFHDWSAYQPSAEAVKDLRAKRSEAGKRGGLAKASRQRNGNDGRNPDSGTGSRGSNSGTGRPGDVKQNAGKGLANATDVAKQNATPTRPEGSGGSTGRDLRGKTVPGARVEEPPPRCPEHIEEPTTAPCGPCGSARRAHVAWELTEAERKRNVPQCRIHRGQPAHNCAPCRADALAGDGP